MTSDVATGPGWELRLGRWQDVLRDVVDVDAVITDPPYSARTHEGVSYIVETTAITGQATRTDLAYQGWTPRDVGAFVSSWSKRCLGWVCAMTSHDIAPAYARAYGKAGRYSFAPLPIIQKRPRLVGDGPASWTVWLCVARPKTREMATWGCLDGAYLSHTEKHGAVAGAKPLSLMRQIVRDYSRPGDLVCDPCAGGGTTLLAAAMEGRRAIGCEMDPATFAKAVERLQRGVQVGLPGVA